MVVTALTMLNIIGGRQMLLNLSANTVTFAKSSDTNQTFTDTLANIEGVIGSSNMILSLVMVITFLKVQKVMMLFVVVKVTMF